jgi:hypothetical protein
LHLHLHCIISSRHPLLLLSAQAVRSHFPPRRHGIQDPTLQ